MSSEIVASARVLGLALWLALAGCVPPGELGPRHEPSGSPTPLPDADFRAYVAATTDHIRAAGGRGDEPLPDPVVLDRAPFELAPARACPDRGRRRGALLIHGLGGSPYVMRALGERLAEACYLVRAILLPGHGTVPGDLLEIDRSAWAEATRRGIASFAGVADEVLLVGFAAGGTLAIDQALDGEQAVPLAGLALIAPALPPRSVVARFARLGGDTLAAGRWAAVFPDDDPVAYESLPADAALQVDRLGRDLDRQQEPLDLPVFMVLSGADATVDPEAALAFFCRDLDGPRRLIWYGPAPEDAADCPFITVRPGTDGGDVASIAHVALPVAPDDPRYGEDGSYLSCLHYFHDPTTPNYLICIDRALEPPERGLRFGEVTEPEEGVVVRRLTWNPDFARMADDLVAFFGR